MKSTIIGFLVVFVCISACFAQLNERGDDPLGLSIREQRVQIIHSETPGKPGTSIDLQQTDPWLAYKLGHSYFEREWKTSEGIFSHLKDIDVAATSNSCAMCHNTPFRSPGAGGNTPDLAGAGKNAPHLFGIGLLEMIGMQIRQKIINKYDRNKNGFLDVPREVIGKRAVIESTPGVLIDFGSLEDLNTDGAPDLNSSFIVFYKDKEGRARLLNADGKLINLKDKEIAGYDLAVGVFSSSVSDHHLASIRQFAIGALRSVMGFKVTDNTISNDSGTGRDQVAFDGWAELSNSGAPQTYFPLPPMMSADVGSFSEGELDILEWFLLNHPPPAKMKQTSAMELGRSLMNSFGCTNCHVSDWKLEAANKKKGFAGDRRFFDLKIKFDEPSGELRGTLQDLTTSAQGNAAARVPKRAGYLTEEVYSDFKHHDLGERFYDYTLKDNELVKTMYFRTAPLWGVGSTAPYGHDGMSLTLDQVIRRHGGEASGSSKLYADSSPRHREALVAYLNSLVLYQPDMLPTDLNGDGKFDQQYVRENFCLGPERFRPELLFRITPQYRGYVINSTSDRYFSYELLNFQALYGRELEYLIDLNCNHIPDKLE